MKTGHCVKILILWIIKCAFLLPFYPYLHAQNLDSLERVAQSGKLKSSEQLQVYHDLSYAYAYTDFNKSVTYAQTGIALAERDNDRVMTGTFYQTLGIAYYMFSYLDSASFFLNKALEYAETEKDEQLEAVVNAALGMVHYQKGLYTEAMQYYMKSLPILEKEKKKEQLGVLYSNIADLYQALHNYDQAFDFYLKAESIALELNDQSSLGCTWIGLSGAYFEKGDYEKALDYAEKAIAILHSHNDLVNEVIALNAAAQCYYEGYKDYDKAEEYAKKGLQISEESGFPASKAISLYFLSDIASSRGNYKMSEDYAFQALDTDSSDININSGLIYNIALANIEMGNRNRAVDYFKRYARIIYSHANKEFQGTLSEMQVKYETEKKETTILILEKAKRLYSWLGVSTGAILLLTLAFFIVKQRLTVSKRKLAEQQIKQLEQEKQLIATQAILDGETAERARLAKDLHDGLGSMLSVVKLNLPQVKINGTIDAESTERFQTAITMLDESIREVRRVAHHIMPDSLTRYGLKASLSDFCNAIPSVQFHYFGNDHRLDQKLEILIYRSAHELVNNALKHAGSTQINVQLVQESDRISLTVQDNGKGFDPLANTKGTGLESIRKRVETHTGKMNLYSSPGNGTEINIEFQI